MKIINSSFEILTNDTELEILKKLETIARTCYKSEDKITDDSCYKFVSGIIKRGHEAMLEHESISVKITCDRGVSHEIVRHRLAAYAQESTRYCNYSNDKYDNQITFINIDPGIYQDNAMMKSYGDGKLTDDIIGKIIQEWKNSCEDAERHYLKMIELGASPNIARSVLPNSTKTEINITANLREWRHFFSLRADTPAHPQMREIAKPLLIEFNKRYPTLFKDLADKLI